MHLGGGPKPITTSRGLFTRNLSMIHDANAVDLFVDFANEL